MDRPPRRRHRGKPPPRAGSNRRSLGFYGRDVCRRRQRARPDRCRHRGRSRAHAFAMVENHYRRRQRSDASLADERLDAAGRPQRPAQRASRPSAQRAAIDAADVPGCNMVTALFNDAELRRRAWDAAAAVVDPEIPVLTIADLGVLRDVAVNDGRVEVAITPTYSGCPAMNMIGLEIELALEREGFRDSKVRTVLSPAWTTDWMSEAGRRKLREYGIAPPEVAGSRRALFGVQQVACPQCGSGDTEVLSEFGSTSCKALWRCKCCREPFDYFKCH